MRASYLNQSVVSKNDKALLLNMKEDANPKKCKTYDKKQQRNVTRERPENIPIYR